MLQVRSSPLKNCLSCSLYIKCKDPHKSVIYSCDRFKKGKDNGLDGMRRLFDAIETPMPDVLARPVGNSPMNLPGTLDTFDIQSVLDNAINSKSIVSPDIKINDGDFKQAANFLEFCLDPKMLNQAPYVSQALIGLRLFGEWCARCSDRDYFDNYNVSDSLDHMQTKIIPTRFGKCPHCKRSVRKSYDSGRVNLYYELAISAGQRSGKSAVVAMLSAYITQRMLKLQRPNEVYGLLPSNTLHGTFVALTYAQAKDTLWDPFYGNVLDSPWFQEYHAMLDDYKERTGEELYKLNDTFIMYRHRRLLLYPAGPDKRTLRGRTRFLSSIDELGWFDNSADSGKVKMDATQVYQALERSLLTVRAAATKLWERGFTEVPTGYFINVSSPSSVRDKIMELVRKSQGSKLILGLIRPTWEMNPNVLRDNPVIVNEFKNDPIGAMRDYGAQPPLSSNQFLSAGIVTGAIGDKPNAAILQHQEKRSKKTKDPMRYATIQKVRRTGKPSCLALDAGYVNNSFAMAVGHLADHKFPVIDAVMEVMPLPGVPLNFSRIYKHVIVPMLDARNIQLVAADRWNSLKILSDLEEDHEVQTRQYSLKYADMRLFKDYLEDKRILLPDPKRELDEITSYDQSNYPAVFKNDAIGHFYLQLLTVQDTGSQIIKGDQLTDDMVRAAMLCTRMLLDEDNAELWEKDRFEVEKGIDISQMGVARGYSGGGGGGSGPPGAQSALGVRKTRG